MQTLSTRTAGLVCGSLLAAVLAPAQMASADPTVMGVTAIQFNPTNFYLFDAIQGTHQFGSASQIDSFYFPGLGYVVDLFSGPSARAGMEYELTMDWSAFGLEFGLPNYNMMAVYLDIKDPGTSNPITAYDVKNGAGQLIGVQDVGSDGGNIRFWVDINLWANSGSAGQDLITIQWRQDSVPAPGVLALLGVAGMVGSRRRRA